MRVPTSGLVVRTTLCVHKTGAPAHGKDLVSGILYSHYQVSAGRFIFSSPILPHLPPSRRAIEAGQKERLCEHLGNPAGPNGILLKGLMVVPRKATRGRSTHNRNTITCSGVQVTNSCLFLPPILSDSSDLCSKKA